MKKKFFSAILISTAFIFFLPASIKTQWHTNGFLSLSGLVAIAPNDLTKDFGETHSSRHVLDYIALELAAPAFERRGYTFETRVFLDDAEAPATFMSLENSATRARVFRLFKEHGGAPAVEFVGAANMHAKLLVKKTLTSGKWLEVAVVLERIATEAALVRLYLNGECAAEQMMKADWSWPEAARLYLGGAPGDRSFSGKMDEVRLSSVARYHHATYEIPQIRLADVHTLGLWNFEAGTMPMHASYAWRESGSGAQFSSFSASRRALQSVRLEWETSFARGLEGFVIERRSAAADARFERCGYMPAVTGSLRSQTYSFVDTTPTSADYYYRLRVVAQNGESGFTPEVSYAQ